jgi:hypothetical protein
MLTSRRFKAVGQRPTVNGQAAGWLCVPSTTQVIGKAQPA